MKRIFTNYESWKEAKEQFRKRKLLGLEKEKGKKQEKDLKREKEEKEEEETLFKRTDINQNIFKNFFV